MKISRFLFTSLALCLALGITAANAADKIVVGTEGAYPPFNSVDASGKLVGFDIDIGNELCKRMGIECEWVAQDWDGIIPGLLAKKYDAIIASMFITEERKLKVSFSDPYYGSAMTHVAAKGAGITNFTAAGLAGKIIGAQGSTTQSAFVEGVYPDSEHRFYNTQDEVNLDMANGRLDLMVGDTIPLFDWTTKTADGACCEVTGEPITDPKWVGDGVGIAARKEDGDLLLAFNKAIAEIIADGTYKKLNDKYFDINVYTMKAE